MWQSLFQVTNMIALAGWTILVFLPRKKLLVTLVLFAGVGLLCLIYSVLLTCLISGVVDPVNIGPGTKAGFTSIAGIRSIFLSDGGVVTGWTHYLALDLFTGLWIAKDADAKRFSRFVQAPILLMTFLAGPLGLLIWLAVRERAARRGHRR